MNAGQIKDEIRRLNRINKIEIYRWIDGEVAEDLTYRIGMYRSPKIRQQIEQMCEVASPERRVRLGNAEQDSLDNADHPSSERTRSNSVRHSALTVPEASGCRS